MQQSIWKLQHPLPSPWATTHRDLIIIQAKGGEGRGKLDFAWLALGNLNQNFQDFLVEYKSYIIEYGGI